MPSNARVDQTNVTDNEDTFPQCECVAVTPAKQLIVLLYLGLTAGLGIWFAVQRDSRFSWGMFSRNMAYEIHYAWVFPDGSRVPYAPGDELQGKARKRLGPRRPPRSGYDRLRNTRYGLGTMRVWVRSYLRHLFLEHRPERALAAEATLRYHINQIPSTPEKPPLETTTIYYPECDMHFLEVHDGA